MTPGKGWLNWLTAEDQERRKALRLDLVQLVAYYWDGAQPMSHPVRDVSTIGFFLVTEQRWYMGTVLGVTLQRTDVDEDDPDRAISINAKVVRLEPDGVAFKFLLPESEKELRKLPNLPVPVVEKKKLQSFLDTVNQTKSDTQ